MYHNRDDSPTGVDHVSPREVEFDPREVQVALATLASDVQRHFPNHYFVSSELGIKQNSPVGVLLFETPTDVGFEVTISVERLVQESTTSRSSPDSLTMDVTAYIIHRLLADGQLAEQRIAA